MSDIPFYSDWKFWSALASFIAIILSQLPHIRFWFRKAKLELEAYSRVMISHKVGNPNIQLHLILANTGGRLLKVKTITAVMKREGEHPFNLSAQTFFQLPTDKDSILLTPFKLAPSEDWGHIVSFFNPFSRSEEKEYRQLESNLRTDIVNKRTLLTNKDVDVPADQKYVDPVLAFFNRKFLWEPGEYEMELRVEAEPKSANFCTKFRFTLFESESQELRDLQNGYQFGAGVFYEPPRITSLFLPLAKP